MAVALPEQHPVSSVSYTHLEDGTYTEPAEYVTKSTNNYSFIFVGDPQIGSSNELKGSDTAEFYQDVYKRQAIPCKTGSKRYRIQGSVRNGKPCKSRRADARCV